MISGKEGSVKVDLSYKNLTEDIMDTGVEIFKYFSDDPAFIERKIVEDLPLCMVVKKDLSGALINKLVSEYYMFAVEYDGEEQLAVAGGFYKKKQKAFDKFDAKLMAKCNAAKR